MCCLAPTVQGSILALPCPGHVALACHSASVPALSCEGQGTLPGDPVCESGCQSSEPLRTQRRSWVWDYWSCYWSCSLPQNLVSLQIAIDNQS